MNFSRLPFFLLVCLIVSRPLAAEVPYNPERSLGVAYRSADNPYYWKNRPPHAAYWQQDVHYRIDAALNPDTRIIDGKLELRYYNNSPDTLREVWFHLYQNAFQKDSYLDQYSRAAGDWRYNRLDKLRQGAITVADLRDGHGVSLSASIDNTMMRVALADPLAPGDSTTFRMRFKTYFGSVQRRMNYNPSGPYDQFNATHWYPRIAVYDHKFGWNINQHYEREFYGDFGTFEVNLTLPNDLIVAATGFLINRDEVLPDSLMQMLAIENYTDPGNGESYSVSMERIAGKTKTWRYRAINVHDFAWTADPSYRIGVAEWQGVTCYAFVREWKASWWADAAQFAADVIAVFSRDFGPYAYHKMIVADADDGMEYPMLTLDGGYPPEYYDLLAHEIGHNWFYGMVGNNETYRAFMDEGFTQFLTAWAMERLVRHPDARTDIARFDYSTYERERYSNYIGYLNSVKAGRDVILNTHSDRFNISGRGREGYWQVYYKTAVMQFALQYVLGEELHRQAMSHYFSKWKFAHPYPEDFRQAIIEYTGMDLNWFFDQWLDRDWQVDYALEKFSTRRQQNGWQAEVTVRRKGRAVMPVELEFTLEDGSRKRAMIPVFHTRRQGDSLLFLPQWTGWGDFNPTYSARISLPQKPVAVVIDPSLRMGDVYRLDNHSGWLPPITTRPSWKQGDWPLDSYLLTWRASDAPFYSDRDGLRLGLYVRGGYLNATGLGDRQLEFSAGISTNLPREPVFYALRWRQPLDLFNRQAVVSLHSSRRFGFANHGISLYYMINRDLSRRSSVLQLNAGLNFARYFDRSYLRQPWLWDGPSYNTLRLALRKNYVADDRGRHRGYMSVKYTGGLPLAREPFARLEAELVHGFRLFKVPVRGRVFAALASSNSPAQTLPGLAQASMDAWVSDPWVAVKGVLPPAWTRDGRLQPGGGGAVRGYSFLRGSDALGYPLFSGNRVYAFNLEAGLWNPLNPVLSKVPFLGKVLVSRLYGFFDVGSVAWRADDVFSPGTWFSDAGLGWQWQPRWRGWPAWLFGKLSRLRIDFPFYLSHPPAGEERIAFRWLAGIGRAF